MNTLNLRIESREDSIDKVIRLKIENKEKINLLSDLKILNPNSRLFKITIKKDYFDLIAKIPSLNAKRKEQKMIKIYWNYFCYIWQHKYYVFVECIKKGMIWHGIVHDLSKFLPSEFVAYAKNFFGGVCLNRNLEVNNNFEKAWLLHQHRNKHHWDYWVSSKGKVAPMPKRYIKQMICDWKAMSKKFDNNWLDWYDDNKSDMVLHEETVLGIRNLR